MAKYDRTAARKELEQRTRESEERREGETLAKYFVEDANLKFVKFGPTKEDPHIFDIIPFRAGDNMPNFMKVKAGKWAYYLDVYIHRDMGPSKTWVVCPLKNYGEPCPICEMIDDMVRDGKEYEDYAAIYPVRRCVYNIVNMTTQKEESKGIQLWEVSYKYSEKQIQTAAKAPRGGGVITFADPDKEVGHSISITVDKDEYRTVSGHKLVPRDYDIDDKILDQAIPLDQIIVRLSYDEISGLLRRGDGSSSQQEDAGARGQERDVPEPDDDLCAGGGKFGVDFDKLSHCEDCDDFRACRKEADNLSTPLRQQPTQKNTGGGSGRSGRGRI